MALTTTGALYGVTVYHTEYYGASPTSSATFRWGIDVDWDGDGVFDGTNEATRLLQFQCTRGRKNWLQPNGQGFYPLSVGAFHITLDNYDGKYDVWNTSSPLYPNVEPGKDVRIRVVDVQTEACYDVFYGIVTDIVPSGYGANAIVNITVEDGLRYLRNNYSFGLSGGVSSWTAQQIIEYILSDCGWRWGTSISFSSFATIPYYLSDGSKSALDDINKIIGDYDEFGSGISLFVATDGTAKNAGTEVGALGDMSANLLKDLSISSPYTTRRNIVKYSWSTYGSTVPTILTYPASTSTITTGNTYYYNNLWAQSSTTAVFVAGNLYNLLQYNKPSCTVKVVNRPAYQFAWDLFDYFTMGITSLGISNSFQIGGVEHYGTPQEVYTTYYLEPSVY